MKRIILYAAAAESMSAFRLPLIRTLVSAGYQVTVVVPDSNAHAIALLRGMPIELVVLELKRAGMNPLEGLRELARLRTELAARSPAIVLAYAHKPILGAAFASMLGVRGLRINGMLCGLGYAFTGSSPKRTLLRTIFQLAYPLAFNRLEGLMLLNEDDRDCFARKIGLPARLPVLVLDGEGIDPRDFPLCPLVADGRVRFLMVARLLLDKGVREFADAARMLRGDPRLEFHLVGGLDSNPASISPAELDGWTREGILQYHGLQQDVRPFLRLCTALVLPSYREGTPRTVLEAMAVGRAVITTDVPGCRQTIAGIPARDHGLVRMGDNGFLIPARNAAALAAAMRACAADTVRAEAMGRAGHQLILDCFSVDRINPRIMAFIGAKDGLPEASRDSIKIGNDA